MGVYRPSNHNFYLDFNANGLWDGASVDKRYDFGTFGDIPVSGKWSAQPVVVPVAGFSGTPTNGLAPLNVSFTDLSPNAPTSWNWSFGDGNTRTLRNPSNIYSSPGLYTVSLTTNYSAGSNTTTKLNYINVTEIPIVVYGKLHLYQIVMVILKSI